MGLCAVSADDGVFGESIAGVDGDFVGRISAVRGVGAGGGVGVDGMDGERDLGKAKRAGRACEGGRNARCGEERVERRRVGGGGGDVGGSAVLSGCGRIDAVHLVRLFVLGVGGVVRGEGGERRGAVVGGGRSGDGIGDDGEVYDGIFGVRVGGGSFVDGDAEIFAERVAVARGGVGMGDLVAEFDLGVAAEFCVAGIFEIFACAGRKRGTDGLVFVWAGGDHAAGVAAGVGGDMVLFFFGGGEEVPDFGVDVCGAVGDVSVDEGKRLLFGASVSDDVCGGGGVGGREVGEAGSEERDGAAGDLDLPGAGYFFGGSGGVTVGAGEFGVVELCVASGQRVSGGDWVGGVCGRGGEGAGWIAGGGSRTNGNSGGELWGSGRAEFVWRETGIAASDQRSEFVLGERVWGAGAGSFDCGGIPAGTVGEGVCVVRGGGTDAEPVWGEE